MSHGVKYPGDPLLKLITCHVPDLFYFIFIFLNLLKILKIGHQVSFSHSRFSHVFLFCLNLLLIFL